MELTENLITKFLKQVFIQPQWHVKSCRFYKMIYEPVPYCFNDCLKCPAEYNEKVSQKVMRAE